MTLLASLVLFFAALKNPEIAFNIQSLLQMAPCQKPLTYSLASIDDKFNISDEEVLEVLKKAELIWEKEAGKELFNYSPEGKIKISFIYDNRQAATDKLKGLGSTIENSTESYQSIKTELQQKKARYAIAEANLNSLLSRIETDKAKFDADVTYWNKKGGAPENIYNQLNAERNRLQAMIDEADKAQLALIDDVREINALVDAVNAMAREINAGVDTYNKIGQSNGKEFEEGIYKSSALDTVIEIYQFHDKAQLERVLAHEFGHALGLEHVKDPKAIMFELNQSTNMFATEADKAELKAVCRF